MLKKTILLILSCIIVLSGCGKKETQTQPESTPPVSSATKQAENTPGPTEGEPEQKKQDEAAPKVEDLEKLVNELNETKDEGKRRELLDKIQGILEQAEAKSEKN